MPQPFLLWCVLLFVQNSNTMNHSCSSTAYSVPGGVYSRRAPLTSRGAPHSRCCPHSHVALKGSPSGKQRATLQSTPGHSVASWLLLRVSRRTPKGHLPLLGASPGCSRKWLPLWKLLPGATSHSNSVAGDRQGGRQLCHSPPAQRLSICIPCPLLWSTIGYTCVRTQMGQLQRELYK